MDSISKNNSIINKTFYHGTKAQLQIGDSISIDFQSNYGKRNKAKYVYFTGTLDAAIWGAELAIGENTGIVYIVEPTGFYEDDPNLTDKKFPGNPTLSYRSKHPLKVIDILKNWQGHTLEQVQMMKANLEKLKQDGIEAIED